MTSPSILLLLPHALPALAFSSPIFPPTSAMPTPLSLLQARHLNTKSILLTQRRWRIPT